MPKSKLVLTVSELNRQSRFLLEKEFSSLWIEGEVSNFVRPSSGHWYFTLKDSAAQIRCAFFKGNNRACTFRPELGDSVLAKGKVSLYEGRGDYQLIVEKMQPAGNGLLAQAFEKLKNKLQDEGLFSAENKQPIPKYAKHIGVITSATGAALQDIISVLKRRCPLLPITVFPSQVQGDAAANELIKAIYRAQKQSDCDVLILTRGGGSLEDLWPFNDELLARTIFACPIPIVSAVGHETDFSISDFVADLRAPTPSAAAEILSPDQQELNAALVQQKKALQQWIRQLIIQTKHRLDHLNYRLRNPKTLLHNLNQKLDDLEMRLYKSTNYRLTEYRLRLTSCQSRLHQTNPASKLKHLSFQLNLFEKQLNQIILQLFMQKQQKLGQLSKQLDLVSPLAVLNRGYALAQTPSGDILRRSDQVNEKDKIKMTLAKGSLECEVIQVFGE